MIARIRKAVTAAIVSAIMILLSDSGLDSPEVGELVQSLVGGLVTGGFTWLFPNEVKASERL